MHVQRNWLAPRELIRLGPAKLVELCRNRPRRRRLSILHLERLLPKEVLQSDH